MPDETRSLEVRDLHINIGDRCLFCRVLGEGPVVLLSSGGGVPGVGAWNAIERRLARFTTVVSYDRAGLGRSDPPPEAQTAAEMASDLDALLKGLRLSTPFTLVGASFGALPVQMYACDYSADVKGLVLLDPTPDQFLAGRHAPSLRQHHPATRVPPRTPAEGSHIERERLAESCAQVRYAIEQQKRMPDIPVVIVSAALRASTLVASAIGAATDTLLLAHQNMAERVKRGRLVVATKSSHTSMLADDPELILQTIESIIDL